MKKYLFFLIIPFLFWGCEKTYDGIVNSGYTGTNYQVSSVNPSDTVYYSPNDSLLLVSITFSSINNLKDVSFDIYSSAAKKLNNNPIMLYDNGNMNDNGDSIKGDKTYSNFYPLSKYDPIGTYKIHYFVIDSNNYNNEVAVNNFVYNNNQNNTPPVVSNLIAPDSAKVGRDSVLTLHITATDSNGLEDIQMVYFNSFNPPDGHPSSANPIIMFDDGSANHGDQTANDGIYSVVVILPYGSPKGVYRWEFQARDRGHLLSNKIIHNITVY